MSPWPVHQVGPARRRVPDRLVGQLDQDPGRALGVDEGDPAATGTGAWQFIYQAIPRRATGRQRPVQVGDPITDVMDSGPTFGEEPRDGAVRGLGFQEFDFGPPEMERDDAGAVGLFRSSGNHSEDISIEW